MAQPHEHDRGLERRIKQHIIAREHVFFAVVQPGFEETAARELKGIGISNIAGIVDGGIEFGGRLADCYRVNICSRTITRLVMRIASFKADGFDKLRKKISSIPWELHVADGTSASFSVTAHHSRLYHTGRIEEECRAGMLSRLEQYGMTCSGPSDAGEHIQEIFIRLDNNLVQVSLDTSGGLLYKRGEKKRVIRAPMRESLAALILHEAHVSEYNLILDPMCGSGTFSLEAAGILMKRCPGLEREYAYMYWPSFKKSSYEYLKRQLSESFDPLMGGRRIQASDIDPQSVKAALGNITDAGMENVVDVRQRDFFRDPAPPLEGSRCLIVMNPPYGARLRGDSEGMYRKIGRVIREYFPACGYAIVTPGVEYEKIMSLPYDRKILFMNGGIKVAAIFKDA